MNGAVALLCSLSSSLPSFLGMIYLVVSEVGKKYIQKARVHGCLLIRSPRLFRLNGLNK